MVRLGAEDRDVRLVLALGASEPCYRAEDDDEDDADEEAPAVGRSQRHSIYDSFGILSLPVCHCEELVEVSV